MYNIEITKTGTNTLEVYVSDSDMMLTYMKSAISLTGGIISHIYDDNKFELISSRSEYFLLELHDTCENYCIEEYELFPPTAMFFF